MSVPSPLPLDCAPHQWATQTFGAADLGDTRRTDRLVATATALATRPDAALPQQLGDPAALKATYRLLANAATTMTDILAPHCAQTRAAAATGTVLLVQDTTTIDLSRHAATTGLGPIGPGDGHGFHLQTVLALTPADRLPLGVLHAAPWVRQPTPNPDETRAARRHRPRESDVWPQQVQAIGAPPTDTRWVHVADRGADSFAFFAACRQTGSDLLVRVVQNRCVTTPDGTSAHLVDLLRAQPPAAHRPLTLPARPGHARRDTEVAVSWTALTLPPPTSPTPGVDRTPLPLWGVRVVETAPVPDGTRPVEWLLLTSVPVVTVADAWERVDWYQGRWVIEELHRGLKSGCQLEATQLRDRDAVWRLLALLLPVAVWLLHLRAVPRQQPHAPVERVANAATVALVAQLTGQPEATTVARFAAQVARLGGYQDRRKDGPPGWQTLWRGRQYLETIRTGIRLASQSSEA